MTKRKYLHTISQSLVGLGVILLTCFGSTQDAYAQGWQPQGNFVVVMPDALHGADQNVDRVFRKFHDKYGFSFEYKGSTAVPFVLPEKQFEKGFESFATDPPVVFTFNGEATWLDSTVGKAGKDWSKEIEKLLKEKKYRLVSPTPSQFDEAFRIYMKEFAEPEVVVAWEEFKSDEKVEMKALIAQSNQSLGNYSSPVQNTWSDPVIYQHVTTSSSDPLFQRKFQIYSEAMSRAEIPNELKGVIRYFHTPGAKQEGYKAALRILQTNAQNGNVLAQFELAEQLRFGNGTKRDLPQAQKWYQSAAASGDADLSALAALNAADLAFLGEQDGPNYKYAQAMYESAAKSNDPRGQTWLGFMSLNGLEIETNAENAGKLFEQASKQGYAPAQFYLAKLHDDGRYSTINDETALQLYAAASRQGYRPATAELYRKAQSGEINNVDLDAEQAEFTIYYATNRNFLEIATPDDSYYGPQRGKRLTFGKAQVSVLLSENDRETKKNFFERVGDNFVKTLRNFFTDETGKFNTVDVTALSVTGFLDDIAGKYNDPDTGKQYNTLIFVHGFMNSFRSSVERAAQIAYVLNFRGPVIVFSWPAREHALEYVEAGKEADWSAEHLDEFFGKLASLKGAYVVAHSMGNEVLLKYAFRHVNNPNIDQTIEEMILAAPDVDTDTFKQYRKTLNKMARRITLYTSSNDAVLELARNIHGYTKLGDAADGVLIVEEVDTIDTGEAGEDLFGHAFSESKLIMEDINLLLNHHASPGDRRTDPIPRPPDEPKYWRLKAN